MDDHVMTERGHHHEHPLPPSGHGTVVLDIGGDVGALVVHTTGELDGAEIELARRGESRAFVHTEVRERRLPHETVYAGVFPAVPAGEYALLGLAGRADQTVTIVSGQVTEVTLSRAVQTTSTTGATNCELYNLE
jgi:hypothetical protein